MKCLHLTFVMQFFALFCLAQTATAPVNGEGTVDSPFQIENLENLYWISSNQANWNKHYIQVADIDASETNTWFSGGGWLPIGNLQNSWSYPPLSPFTGSYDGQFYKISNLYVNRPSTSGIGLFGSTRNAVMKRIIMENVSMIGNEGVGAIVGAQYVGDVVDYCYSSGNISGNRCIGGITGNVWVPDGQSSGYCRVGNCFSNANISGNQEVGGLVGRMSITFSSPAEIVNSYATGNVLAINNWAGGLVGYFYSGGKVINCYSTGTVTGNNSGGMVGRPGNSTWTNCFWDIESSNNPTSLRGTGKSSAEMKDQDTFTSAGWDFQCETDNGTADYWGLTSSFNSGYPFLSFVNEISDVCFIVWTGNENSTWTNSLNWNPNVVPGENRNVLIPGELNIYPIITDNVTIHNLIVELDAFITITEDFSLVVNNTIENNGALNIASSSVGDASLICNNLIGTGIFNVDRYISGNSWHLVSSPINNAFAGIFEDLWLRPFNESTNSFGDYIIPTGTPMPTGQGFGVWSFNDEIRRFSGTINYGNTGPFDAQLTGTAGTASGWNLMGNPYTSPIDWDATNGWTKTNIANSVYVWNNNQYASYINGVGTNGGSKYIASGQGFFVQAIATGASLGMSKEIQVLNSVDFLKNQEVVPNVIKIKVLDNNYSDETAVVIRQGASDYYSYETDAVKLLGSELAPQLFIKKSDQSELSISAFNSLTDIAGRNLNLYYPQEGEYKLLWTHTLAESTNIILYDTKNETIINKEEEYIFYGSNSDSDERFIFETITSHTQTEKYPISIYVNNNNLYIKCPENAELDFVEIYSITGQVLMRFREKIKNLNNLPSAIYLVKLKFVDGTIKTQRVIVH